MTLFLFRALRIASAQDSGSSPFGTLNLRDVARGSGGFTNLESPRISSNTASAMHEETFSMTLKFIPQPP